MRPRRRGGSTILDQYDQRDLWRRREEVSERIKRERKEREEEEGRRRR